jgi:FixJ family two-component response regulator
MHAPDIVEMASKIYEINTELISLRNELDDVRDQRAELDKCIDKLCDIRAKVVMLKINGKNNRQIAYDLNYSRRHVERIVRESFELLKRVGEMSHHM